MKTKTIILIGILLCLCQLIPAQAMWQNEAILRKNCLVDWNNSPLHTIAGDNFILWSKGTYGSQGLYLHKFDNLGNPVWNEDLLISGSNNIKWDQEALSDTLGNLFIYWDEYNPVTGHTLSAVKLNANGQFLWQPQIISFNVPQIHLSKIQPDNQGGVYIVYGNISAGQESDLFCQHISSAGQLSLPGNGAQLTGNIQQEDVIFLQPTTDNGLIIGYYFYNSQGSGYRSLKVIRMSSDYQLVWFQPMVLSQTQQLSTLGNITAINTTQYIISWDEDGDFTSNSYLQKFDQNGNTFFTPPILTSGYSSYDTNHCIDNNGNIFVTITSNGLNRLLKKYDVNGNSLWANPVVIADSVFQILNPEPDNLGGCYVLMKLREDAQNSYFDIRVQHVAATGNLLFADEGVLIEDNLPYEYHYFIAYSFTDRLYFYWINQYQDKKGLYFNIRDTAGELISTPKITISEGLAGNAQIQGMIARNNDLLVYWADSRNNSNAQTGNMLYFRTITPDGTMSQPEDGTPLVLDYTNSGYLQSVYLPNGNTVFIWVKSAGVPNSIMGQMIDSNNNVLWEPGGRILANIPTVYSDSRFIVSNEGNDIYIASCAYISYDNTRTYVQKITDGQAMWGDMGIEIDTNHNSTYLKEQPVFFQNRFLVVQGQINHNASYNWVVHLEPDGTYSTGWLPNGFVLNTSNDYYPLGIEASLLNGNLYVFYLVYSSGYTNYRYSVLGEDGTLLLSNQPFVTGSWNQFGFNFDTTDDLVFSLCLDAYTLNQTYITYNKLSGLNTFPWGDSVHVVCTTPANGFDQSPSIIGFNNGGYLISWLEGYKISGGYINDNGDYLSPQGGIALADSCLSTYYTAMLGNELYIAWKDFKAGYYTFYGEEPRMQKFANLSIVNNDDDYLPGITCNSLVCYPNPFNLSTTISFTLAKAGYTSLKIYNTKGQLVKTLLNNVKSAGQNKLVWNGLNEEGKPTASGLYFYKLDAPDYSKTCKMMLMK